MGVYPGVWAWPLTCGRGLQHGAELNMLYGLSYMVNFQHVGVVSSRQLWSLIGVWLLLGKHCLWHGRGLQQRGGAYMVGGTSGVCPWCVGVVSNTAVISDWVWPLIVGVVLVWEWPTKGCGL